jgi:phospholipase C
MQTRTILPLVKTSRGGEIFSGDPKIPKSKLLFDHFVVLMLENRSFDRVFGSLGIGDGLHAGHAKYLKPGDKTTAQFNPRDGGDYTAIGDGPSHSLKQTNMQPFGTGGDVTIPVHIVH